MEIPFSILGWILTAIYLSFIIWLIIGVKRKETATSKYEPSLSVIVAARNEESRIERCINALIKQNYPQDKLEIIIVNDRSSDSTGNIVKSYSEMDKRVKLIEVEKLPEKWAPKKHALNLGIENSRGEIIFTTDADCYPEPDWIRHTVKFYADDTIGLVAGYSPLISEKTSFTSKIMELESLSLNAVACGSFNNGYPLTCSGRNLSYRRSAFNSAGGFSGIEHFISGDDDLLMHRIVHLGKLKAKYILGRRTACASEPPSDFKALVFQRIRHASKGIHYLSLPDLWGLKILLPIIFLYNIFLAVGIPLGIAAGFYMPLYSLIIKSSGEFILLYLTADAVGRKRLVLYFPLAELIHIFYISLFTLLGIFGKFTWKGKKTGATKDLE